MNDITMLAIGIAIGVCLMGEVIMVTFYFLVKEGEEKNIILLQEKK